MTAEKREGQDDAKPIILPGYEKMADLYRPMGKREAKNKAFSKGLWLLLMLALVLLGIAYEAWRIYH